MKKHLVAFVLIILMALVCSLDSWGESAGTDIESYGYFSGIMGDFIKSKVNKIPGFRVECGPWDSCSNCSLYFPESDNMMRAIHAAQNITDVLAGMLQNKVEANMQFITFVDSPRGPVLIYKINYNYQYDVWATSYRFP
jgi:hypothetical protein